MSLIEIGAVVLIGWCCFVLGRWWERDHPEYPMLWTQGDGGWSDHEFDAGVEAAFRWRDHPHSLPRIFVDGVEQRVERPSQTTVYNQDDES